MDSTAIPTSYLNHNLSALVGEDDAIDFGWSTWQEVYDLEHSDPVWYYRLDWIWSPDPYQTVDALIDAFRARCPDLRIDRSDTEDGTPSMVVSRRMASQTK